MVILPGKTQFSCRKNDLFKKKNRLNFFLRRKYFSGKIYSIFENILHFLSKDIFIEVGENDDLIIQYYKYRTLPYMKFSHSNSKIFGNGLNALATNVSSMK